MNVVIISTFDSKGGAAKAAHRLYLGLNNIGVNANMLVRDKLEDDPNIIQAKLVDIQSDHAYIKTIGKINYDYIRNNRTALSNTLFSLPYPGYDLASLDIIRNADIINLHWVNKFQSIESLSELLKLNKPIIWTLHDMWPMTGGCHYTAACKNYITDCDNCPQLKKDPYKLSYHALSSKIDHLKRNEMFLISPSHWLAESARASYLFNEKNVEVIPYGIPDDIFYPINKNKAKRILSVPQDTITIFFGAPGLGAKRKGFRQLKEALDYCMKNKQFVDLVRQNKIMALIAGESNEELQSIPLPFKAFGFISSEQEMNLLYNAADIFVLPSLEDNLPNQMLESLSCETPVIAFNIGGIPDLIKDNVNGKLVPLLDVNAYGEAIIDLIFDENKREKMGKKGRKQVVDNYQLKHQAERYMETFNRLLKSKKSITNESHSSSNPEAPLNLSVNKNLLPLFEKYS